MKYSITFILAFSLLFVAGACKKKKNTTPDKPKGVVICKVNGTAWQSGDATSTVKIGSYTYYKTSATLRNDSIWFTGIRNQGDTSGIYFYAVKLKAGAVGSVTGTTSAYNGGIYLKLYDLNTLVSTLGKYNVTYELNITAVNTTDKTVTGNFIINMMSGGGNVIITEGEFIELKYK